MAIFNLIRKELHQMRWIIIIGLLVSAGTGVIVVATFHYMGQIVEELPGDLLESLLQFELARELLLIFRDYSIFVWSQWNAKNLFQLVTLFSIIIAATQFAGEVSRRTMSFFLTRPVTRSDAYLGKVGGGVLVLLIILAGGTVLLLAASLIMGYQADWGRIFAALLLTLIWGISYYLLAAIISTFNREPVTAGVLIGLSGVLLSIPGLFNLSRQFSIFYQMRAVDYFIYGDSLLPPLLTGFAINAVLLLLGIRLFAGKDF